MFRLFSISLAQLYFFVILKSAVLHIVHIISVTFLNYGDRCTQYLGAYTMCNLETTAQDEPFSFKVQRLSLQC